MAFSIAFPVAGECVVFVFGRKGLAVLEQRNDVVHCGHLFALFSRFFEFSSESACLPNCQFRHAVFSSEAISSSISLSISLKLE